MADKIEDGGFAFPLEGRGDFKRAGGMSLRDWFAGQALIGFTNAYVGSGWSNPNEYQIGVLVANSYVAADAMIAARKGRS